MLIDKHPLTLRCRDQVLSLTTPIVMGILNATPDSFFSPSRISKNVAESLDLISKMVEDGASILDVGGMSSRPGADEISAQEEMDRILPVILAVRQNFPDIVVSVDTFRAAVAKEAVRAGIHMINSISGDTPEADLLTVTRDHQLAYVLMHRKGDAKSMHLHTDYVDLIGDLLKYFIGQLSTLRTADIADIIIDPGFGFSKTSEQNYELIRRLEVFHLLNCPILVGVSRKSTLSKTISREALDTLNATTALHMAALLNGANILRVHDVRAAADAIAVYQQLADSQSIK